MPLTDVSLAPRFALKAATGDSSATGLEDAVSGLGDFSRQLTAPLSVASGYAEALGRDPVAMTSGRARVDMARILSSCRQARSLLDGLLAIVRLQRQGPRAERSIVDPCELLQKAMSRNAPLLLDKSLALGGAAHGATVARIDRSAVDCVIDNLVAALVPRVGCGAEIWIGVHREITGVCMRVSVDPRCDAGAQPWTQDAIPARSAECGLAFVVAARIVELLGGRIDLDDAGNGARAWRVRLPI